MPERNIVTRLTAALNARPGMWMSVEQVCTAYEWVNGIKLPEYVCELWLDTLVAEGTCEVDFGLRRDRGVEGLRSYRLRL